MSKKIVDDKTKGLAYYYDEELFDSQYASEVDPTSLVLLESGVVVRDEQLTRLLAGGGNYFTIPFYKDLEGEPQVYDGETDVKSDFTDSGKQSGVAYAQMKGFASKIFVNDFTSADPMGNIIKRIAKYWAKIDQKTIINILEGIFAITGNTDWEKHKYNIATKGANATDENRIGLTTLRDASVKALGENADNLTLAIMHSSVANRLSNLQVLNFFEYQKDGMTYDVRVARSGNLLVLVSDQVPVSDSASATGELEYVTYICGLGAILEGLLTVEKPSDYSYDPKKAGGLEELITRRRKCYHPNGFSYKGEVSTSLKPSDFKNGENWELSVNAQNINLVRVVTN